MGDQRALRTGGYIGACYPFAIPHSRRRTSEIRETRDPRRAPTKGILKGGTGESYVQILKGSISYSELCVVAMYNHESTHETCHKTTSPLPLALGPDS